MSAIIVPIDVQALSVSASGVPPMLASGRVDYSKLAARSYQPVPIAATCDTTTATRAALPGVHLHWALPGALTCHADWSAFVPTMTAPGLLPAPDMWVVVRINPALPPTSPDFLQSWVVESSYCGLTRPSGYAATMPIVADGQANPLSSPFGYLGRSTPFSPGNWPPSDPNLSTLFEGLTALGHGLGHFAGAYQDCSNVFGLYDPQGESVTAPVSYLVVGWYNTPSSDPLSTPRTAGEVLQYLNWQVTGAGASDAMPTQTLFAGFVSGVGAADASPALPYSTPTLTPATIAVGASVPSALSALVASSEDGGSAELARILTAFQYGRLDLADNPDAAPEIEDMLHRLSFRAESGHPLTVITPRAGQQAASLSPPDAVIGAQLQSLTAQEIAAAQLSRQAEALSTQLSLDWQNYAVQVCDPNSTNPAIETVMTTLLDPQLFDQPPAAGLSVSQVIDAVNAKLQEANATAAAQRQTLEQLCGSDPALDDSAQPTGYHVNTAISPSYFTPLPPAFAVTSPALECPDRIGGSLPGNATPLPVRSSGQILSGLTIAASSGITGGATATIATSGFTSGLNLPDTLNGTLVGQLIVETILTDPNLAATLSDAASAPVTAAALASALTGAWQDDAVPTGFAYADVQGDSAPALPPSLGVTLWSVNPWLPLFLQWSGTVVPFGTATSDAAFDPDTILSNYQLSNADTELVPIATPKLLDGVSARFGGLGTLSPNSSIALAQALAQAVKSSVPIDIPAQALADIQAMLVDTPIHTGILSNLYDQALQQSRAPQLPPVGWLQGSGSSPYAAFATAMTAAATPSGVGLPINFASPNTLLPIVGGAMTQFQLTVIDCFGQRAELPLEIVWPTDEVLAVPSDLEGVSADFLLPPRIALPARLLAQWEIPSDGAALLDNPVSPVSNPVRGWILPSFVEQSVVLYDASGTPLVEVMGAGGFAWRTVPGSPLPPEAGDGSPGDLLAALNALGTVDAAFIAFVGQMTGFNDAADGSDFAAFVTLLGDIAPTIQPSLAIQDPASLALVGRPLAVVCASIDASLRGTPPVDQSPSAFNAFVGAMQGAAAADPPSRDTSGVMAVALPLLVGDDARQDDGLYGFFLDDGTFCAAYDTPPNGAVSGATSQVSLTLGGAPLALTMLVDPAAPVHFATGVLPVVSLSVPTSYYRAAIAAMTFAMPLGPVLTAYPSGANGGLPLVLPSFGQGDWTWVQPTQITGTMQWAAPVPTQALPPNQVAPAGPPLLLDGWLSLPLSDAAQGGDRG